MCTSIRFYYNQYTFITCNWQPECVLSETFSHWSVLVLRSICAPHLALVSITPVDFDLARSYYCALETSKPGLEFITI